MPIDPAVYIQKSRARYSPYRAGIWMIWDRLKWDLRPVARRSRRLLRAWKDKEQGKRGLILCNGPSLNQVDFEAVAEAQSGVVVIGLNKVNLLFNRTKMRPDYIAAVNPFVLEQNAPFYNETKIPLFLGHRGTSWVKSSRTLVAFFHETSGCPFVRDVSGSLAGGATVTYVALQLAFHLGLRDVALVGCDHSFTAQGAANQTVASGSKDPDHFDPHYFAGGQPWQLPDLVASEHAYAMAQEAYRAHDGRLTNCTEGGKLELFPRQSLNLWLQSVIAPL